MTRCFECQKPCKNDFVSVRVKHVAKQSTGLKVQADLNRVYCRDCGEDYLLLDEEPEQNYANHTL